MHRHDIPAFIQNMFVNSTLQTSGKAHRFVEQASSRHWRDFW